MRAAYTHTFDFFRGPLGTPANGLRAQVAGRFVPAFKIRPIGMPFSGFRGWVTTDYPLGAAASVLVNVSGVRFNVGTEDRISCAAIGLLPTPIYFRETVTTASWPPYVRYWIGRWPSPGP